MMKWIAYNELAWTDTVLASPSPYEEETMSYVNRIKDIISAPSPTLLHLGCGAGGHDFHLKSIFW